MTKSIDEILTRSGIFDYEDDGYECVKQELYDLIVKEVIGEPIIVREFSNGSYITDGKANRHEQLERARKLLLGEDNGR
jgi:hypothetical protein